ncbi:tape measure domain-containing protein [Flavobacterium fluvii]|uniref:Tape measure domain-containing protein n=1 Tax=Flavobacterium fluvii TaxID=468056 RepID=A0A1M5FDJ5_9FLAO|nr:tape measure protein [Flavobacterium fluvii]SHF89577.1 tape measure domain-containing protein [Flavobacterium fluvii]
MAEGTITRKDIITDDALNWGEDYKKTMELAIGKNKEFAISILEMNEANKLLRGSTNQKEFAENSKKLNEQNKKSLDIWKEQIQLENALIATKKKTELATEGTNRELTKERVLLAETNKKIKQETLERLGLVGAYEKLNKARTDAKNKLRDLIASEKASTLEIQKAQRAFDGYDAKIKKADKAVGDFSKNVGNYKSAFSGIGNIMSAFGIVGGITAFVSISKDIFNTTKELQSLDLALKSVTETQQNFQEQQTFLTAIADKYGLEIKNLTKQYTAFYVAAKDKLAAGEIQDLFENISKSGSALGLSNETLERSFMALNQMLSKGTVASEELRGQLAEALPGSVQAMLKAVQKLHPEIKNLTEKGLFEMIKAGKILASDVLPETARQLVIMTGADKAEGIDTLTKSTNKFTNSWTNLIRTMSDSKLGSVVGGLTTGVINWFTDMNNAISKAIKGHSENLMDAKKEGIQLGESEFRKDLQLALSKKENVKKTQEEVRKILRDGYAWEFNAEMDLMKKLKKQRSEASAGVKAGGYFDKLIEDQNKKVQAAAAKIRLSRKEQETAPSSSTGSGTGTGTEKKLQGVKDTTFELEKQRLERIISVNNEVVANSEATDEARLMSLEISENAQIELITKSKENQLKLAAETFDKELKEGNKTSAGLIQLRKNYEADKVKITEEAAFKIEDIEKNTAEVIDKINEFDAKSYEDNIKRGISVIEIANNEEIAAEEKRFQEELALGYENDKAKEKAAQDHERNLFNIKKEGLIAIAKLQISVVNAELDAYEAKAKADGVITQKESDFILAKRKELSELSVKLIQSEGDKFKENEIKKGKTGAERLAIWYTENEKAINDIADISMQSLDILSQVSNSFSEAEIQKIDDKIAKNNEYYDKQIELAGNDARQKDLLEKERAKKNEELEKKKRKEQHKQAIFDKAVTVAMIGIQTALAIMKAAPAIPLMIMAGLAGAVATATAIATPIPKYKMGRKGGKAEIAWVGDGGVSEVITSSRGLNPRLTPNIPTLTHLNQGDIVHKSMADYQAYMRASVLTSFGVQKKRIDEFQANENNNKELVEEMRLTRKAIEKNKTNVTVNLPKVDIPHEIWKMKNTNWNP